MDCGFCDSGGGSPLGPLANHMMTVPGEKQWALFKRGGVNAIGFQKVVCVVLIPTEGSGIQTSLSKRGFGRDG
jgi:hypothetical protein